MDNDGKADNPELAEDLACAASLLAEFPKLAPRAPY